MVAVRVWTVLEGYVIGLRDHVSGECFGYTVDRCGWLARCERIAEEVASVTGLWRQGVFDDLVAGVIASWREAA